DGQLQGIRVVHHCLQLVDARRAGIGAVKQAHIVLAVRPKHEHSLRQNIPEGVAHRPIYREAVAQAAALREVVVVKHIAQGRVEARIALVGSLKVVRALV
nr:hypothetical protein [Tanacetum cinerariifolium]